MAWVSDVVVFLFSLMVLVADSFFLLFPKLAPPEKRKDRSLMNRVYGPVMGLKDGHGGFVDGLFVTSFLLPVAALVFVHNNNDWAQEIVISGCVMASGFLPLIGIYMAVTGFLPGFAPVAFAVFGLVLGMFGGALRIDNVHCPVLPFLMYQVVWSVIFGGYAVRIMKRLPQIPSVYKMEIAKMERYQVTQEWPANGDRPAGTVVDPQVEANATKELESLHYDSYLWLVGMYVTLIVVMVHAVVYFSDQYDNDNYDDDEWMVYFLMLPLNLVWLFVTTYITKKCVDDKDTFLGMSSTVSSGTKTGTSYQSM